LLTSRENDVLVLLDGSTLKCSTKIAHHKSP
jgi:hypothetical protein